MSRKQKLKSGIEYDLVFGKQFYSYLQKSKICKWIKRRLNKRFRQDCKKDLQKDLK